MLKFLTILFIALALAPEVRAEREFIVRHSLSKQFVVYGPKTSARYPVQQQLSLDPNFLTVSCERIKQVVLAELAGAERRQLNLQNLDEGKIYVVLHPGSEQQPLITPLNHSARANFRVELPNQIEGAQLIETITEVVLLEMANRHGENFVPVPRWLSSGIAAHVKSTMPETLLLQANQRINTLILSGARNDKVLNAKVHVDPIAQIRKAIETFPPLTFAELGSPENLSPERSRHYEECAQLFVHELLALKNGESLLRQMIDQLSVQPDWQTAFLATYQNQFRSALDIEKWWSLRLVNLSGRDISQLLSREQSMQRLDAALRVPLQRAPGSSQYQPDATLQEILSNFGAEQQKSILQKVTFQLRALRIRVQPEFVILLDEYDAALENFLQNDVKQGVFKRIFIHNNLDDLRQSTRERLDALDRVRTALRSRPKPSTREEAIFSALQFSSGNSASTTRKQVAASRESAAD
jgi:hypothetical protein